MTRYDWEKVPQVALKAPRVISELFHLDLPNECDDLVSRGECQRRGSTQIVMHIKLGASNFPMTRAVVFDTS